jgi:hypothetical protein
MERKMGFIKKVNEEVGRSGLDVRDLGLDLHMSKEKK